MDPLRLALFILLDITLLVGLSYYTGFEPTSQRLADVLDAFTPQRCSSASSSSGRSGAPTGQRTPREAGGLQGMTVSKTALSHLEPTVLVKLLLLTDIFLDGFQLKTHRRYGIAARPETLAGKVPYLPTQLTGYRQGTLSLQKPYH
jgi:hypothetical protein